MKPSLPFELHTPKRLSALSLRCESLEPFGVEGIRENKNSPLTRPKSFTYGGTPRNARSESDISHQSPNLYPDMNAMSHRLGIRLGEGSGVAMRDKIETTRTLLSLNVAEAGDQQLEIIRGVADEQLGSLSPYILGQAELSPTGSSANRLNRSFSKQSNDISLTDGSSDLWEVPEVDRYALTLSQYLDVLIVLSEAWQLQGNVRKALEQLVSAADSVDEFIRHHFSSCQKIRSIDSAEGRDEDQILAEISSKLQKLLFSKERECFGVGKWVDYAFNHRCFILAKSIGCYFQRLCALYKLCKKLSTAVSCAKVSVHVFQRLVDDRAECAVQLCMVFSLLSSCYQEMGGASLEAAAEMDLKALNLASSISGSHYSLPVK